MTPRAWKTSLALVAVTMAAGIAVRFAPLALPPPVVKYAGSMLWALLIYWIVSTLVPGWRRTNAVLMSGALATGVELFKLYRSPGMDAFRLTLPGMLLLGRYFSVRDIAAYWVAIAVGAILDGSMGHRGR